MSIFVKIADFKGQHKLPKDKFSKTDLQDYINKYEVLFLQNLLGCELYEAFRIDFLIDGSKPTDARFTAIWEAFCKDNKVISCNNWDWSYYGYDSQNCPRQVISQGILKMLLGFIYFKYIADLPVKANIGGIYKNDQANGTEAIYSASKVYTNYNDSIDSYCAIQWCICTNPSGFDYTDYNGIPKEKTNFV